MLESLLISYFLGAIPFSYIFTKTLCGKDITTLGSRNVGTSNAVYSCGMKVGLLCLIGDFLLISIENGKNPEIFDIYTN